MTDQPPPMPELAPLRAAVAVDPKDPSGLPVVVLQIASGSTVTTFRIDARQAAQFITTVAEGVIKSAAAALAAAGPQLVTPTNGLLIAGNGTVTPLNRADRRRNGLG